MKASPVIPSRPRSGRPAVPRPGLPGPTTRSFLLAGLVALASPLRADDCILEVQANPPIVLSGQSAQVNVLAHFPASGYAFAEADFDVLATQPQWTYASSGVIAGANVVGMHVEQAHSPQLGILADPSNPIRLWTGLFSPASDAPAFVSVVAAPTAFAYYPGVLTPSSVPCAAAPGQSWIFANPLYVGKVAGAPGAGTTLETGPESFVASSTSDEILIALLLPAVQNPRKGGVGLEFDRPPHSLEFRVHDSDSRVAFDEVSFNYEKIPWNYSGDRDEGYAASLQGLPDGTPVEVEVLRRGRRLARFRGESGPTLFSVSRLPDALSAETRLQPRTGWGASSYQYGFDGTFLDSAGHAGGVNVAFGDGSVRFLSDATEVRVLARRPVAANNLKQLGLGCHSVAARGVSRLTLTPFTR